MKTITMLGTTIACFAALLFIGGCTQNGMQGNYVANQTTTSNDDYGNDAVDGTQGEYPDTAVGVPDDSDAGDYTPVEATPMINTTNDNYTPAQPSGSTYRPDDNSSMANNRVYNGTSSTGDITTSHRYESYLIFATVESVKDDEDNMTDAYGTIVVDSITRECGGGLMTCESEIQEDDKLDVYFPQGSGINCEDLADANTSISDACQDGITIEEGDRISGILIVDLKPKEDRREYTLQVESS